MGALLLPVSLGLAVLRTQRVLSLSQRTSLIEMAVVTVPLWGAGIVAVTEGASLVGLFRPIPLRLAWVGLVLLQSADLARVWQRAQAPRHPWIASPRIVLAAISLCVFVTFVVALAAGPSNWDSMTYHLPRVMHWLTNGSVWPYETVIARQVWQPPFAEYVVAQVIALAGSDVAANLVQWSAYVGTLVVSWRIVGQLGASTRARAVTVLLVATIPMAILQASTTQNDVVATFFVLTAASLALDARDREPVFLEFLALGLSCVLAVLTKGSVLPLVLPIGASAAWWVMRRSGVRVRRLIVPVSVGLLVLAPHYVRNWVTFDDPLGPVADEHTSTVTPALVASTTIRNLALEVATPLGNMNRSIERAVVRAHEQLGMDPSDSRATFPNTYFRVPDRWRHEDTAGSPVHTILMLVGIAALMGGAGTIGSRFMVAWALAGFVLFSALVPWMPWNARLLLPYMALAVTGIGPVLVPSAGRGRVRLAVVTGVVLVAVGYSAAVLFAPEGRPLVGARSVLRTDGLTEVFNRRPDHAPGFARLAGRDLGDCRRIGFAGGVDSWEYPIWMVLNPGARGSPVVVPLQVQEERINESVCAIVAVDTLMETVTVRASGQPLRLAWREGPISLFVE